MSSSSVHSSSTEGHIPDALPLGPRMQLFRDNTDTIRAGPSVNMASVPRSLAYDPARDLERVWATDMGNWVSLSVADLKFDDIARAAIAIEEENDRVARHTNPYIAELTSIAMTERNSAQTTALKLSIRDSVAYRLTAEELLVSMIGQIPEAFDWTNRPAQTSQSATDKFIKDKLLQPITAINDAGVASLRSVPFDYDIMFTKPDTQRFTQAKSGGHWKDVLRATRSSRIDAREMFMSQALCENPLSASSGHKPHPPMLRRTTEPFGPSNTKSRAAGLSRAQRRLRNKSLVDLVFDALEARHTSHSTQATPQIGASKSGQTTTKSGARKKRRRANKQLSKAEVAAQSKASDEADLAGEAGSIRTEDQPVRHPSIHFSDKTEAVLPIPTIICPTASSSRSSNPDQELVQSLSDETGTVFAAASSRHSSDPLPEETPKTVWAESDAGLSDDPIHVSTNWQQDPGAQSSPPSAHQEEELDGCGSTVGSVYTPRTITEAGETRSVIDLSSDQTGWAESQSHPEDMYTNEPTFDPEDARRFLARDAPLNKDGSFAGNIYRPRYS